MPYGRSRLTASAQVGDPFLGGLIKGIGKVASKVGGLLPGPAGILVGGAGGLLAGKKRSLPGVGSFAPTRRPIDINLPFSGRPGAGITVLGGGEPQKKKRRRMNPTNIKALRRAVRREEAFIRAAKKTGLVAVPKAKRVRRAARPRRRS